MNIGRLYSIVFRCTAKAPKHRLSLRLQTLSTETKRFRQHPLPPLPEAPEYPCPYLVENEISTYLSPLYTRGWQVASSYKGIPESESAHLSPELSKEFQFTNGKAATGFFFEIADKTHNDGHHPTLTFTTTSVHIYTHTHTAAKFQSDGELSSKIEPGITLRDVRVALIAEQLCDKFYALNLVKESVTPHSEHHKQQPYSAQLIEENRYPSKRTLIGLNLPVPPKE